LRNIYIAVLTFLVLSVLLFIGSFIYLDKEKHGTYYYVVNLGGHECGTIKVDSFETEDKRIYKSAAHMPFSVDFTEFKSRLILDRRYNIESFMEEKSGNGPGKIVYLENKKGLVSFVARYGSRFAAVTDIPIRGYTYIFDEFSPATYLALIENYNFRKGRSQGFNGLTPAKLAYLPPMKRLVTLTSVRDEYIKVGRRKIKTEYLLLKIKNYPQGGVWVAKSDKSLIKLEIPQKGLSITRVFSPVTLSAKGYVSKGDEYISEEVVFKNRNIQLAGTLTIPKKEGKLPAVLLIAGSGPQDREYQGFFASIADYLSKNGFCALRFDSRGVGSSGGDAMSSRKRDEIEDAVAALEFLAGAVEKVDPQKIAVIAHSEGAFSALAVAAGKDTVKALVFMAPSVYLGPEKSPRAEILKNMASKNGWSDDYLNLAMRAAQETEGKAAGTKHDWAYILGKRYFLKGIREELAERPKDAISSVKSPVLVLQGKEDEEVPMEFASYFDKALEEAGNPNHALVYYGYLGRFFGNLVDDGTHKMHYEVDKEVLENIKNWLNKNILEPVPPPQAEEIELAGK